jgi:hypothetical protein
VGLIDLNVEKARQGGAQHLVAALETVFGCVMVQGFENGLFVRSQQQGDLRQSASRDGVGDGCASLRSNFLAVKSDLLANNFGFGPQFSELRRRNLGGVLGSGLTRVLGNAPHGSLLDFVSGKDVDQSVGDFFVDDKDNPIEGWMVMDSELIVNGGESRPHRYDI